MTVFTDRRDFRDFTVEGNAFTVTSRRTGAAFTYRMRMAAKGERRFYVELRTADGWQYVGLFFPSYFARGPRFFPQVKGTTKLVPSLAAIAFVCERVIHGEEIPDGIELRAA